MAIGTYLRVHPRGALFVAPFDVVLSHYDVVEPDLLYISRERSNVLTEKHVRGAPDLAVEIVSPGTRRRDEDQKRKIYERFGVSEYWVIDPELDTVEVHRQLDGAFIRVSELAAERKDALATPLLPGWSAPLVEIFVEPLRPV
jgi:Uma2 family endonuclease